MKSQFRTQTNNWIHGFLRLILKQSRDFLLYTKKEMRCFPKCRVDYAKNQAVLYNLIFV